MEFWLKITGEVVELSKTLNLTDNDLTRLLARWRPRGSSFACGLSALVQEIVTHRRLMELGAELQEGEEMVPLVDLVYRRKKREAAGEN